MIQYEVTDGVCVLRLDNPPLNTLTLPLLGQLTAAVRKANADETVRRIVIVGNSKHFSAGADINLFAGIDTRGDAIELSRVFQDAFQQVADSQKPVTAAMAGKMLGGALELAMACNWRVCAEDARCGMPEVNLGINPGAGGTQRLPRLIGIDAALDMLLTGRPISAALALELGLVDAVCPADELLQTAMQSEPERRDRPVLDWPADDAELRRAPEQVPLAQIVHCVKTGLSELLADGLKAEQTSFADCMETLETRNKIYLFFATRKTGKLEDAEGVARRKISKIAVIGCGSMGTGIAHAMIIAGLPVLVYDENPEAVDRAIDKISRSVNKRVADGKMDSSRAEKMLSLLTAAEDWNDLADADAVIEAVFEDVAVKQNVLRKIEATCSSETLLATNTSTISLDVLAESLEQPERLVGMHFFNPAHLMPLVEVIRREETPAELIATALKFCSAIRKTPVLVNNRVGFLVNRIFLPYIKEAFWLLEEGARAEDVDAAMVEFGFPMGPLTLIDMAGIDILAFTDEVMRSEFPRHGPISAIVTQLVDRGQLGQKSGEGIYKYQKDDYTPHSSPSALQIVESVQSERSIEPRRIDKEEITERLVMRMVAEAFRVLGEGIAQRESDIDVAMVLGIGFPNFRGGVLKYARDVGIDKVEKQLRQLEEQYGERYSPGEINTKGES